MRSYSQVPAELTEAVARQAHDIAGGSIQKGKVYLASIGVKCAYRCLEEYWDDLGLGSGRGIEPTPELKKALKEAYDNTDQTIGEMRRYLKGHSGIVITNYMLKKLAKAKGRTFARAAKGGPRNKIKDDKREAIRLAYEKTDGKLKRAEKYLRGLNVRTSYRTIRRCWKDAGFETPAKSRRADSDA